MKATEKRRASITVNSLKRRDGKYKVRIVYPGAPNMFGGFEYPNTYNKLYTAEKIVELAKTGRYDLFKFPAELLSEVN